MLSASHNRAYQDFLTLLTKFNNLLADGQDDINPIVIRQEFKDLEQWFGSNIANLNSEQLDREIVSRWQSVQTEMKREFQLLKTGILFFITARQNATKSKKLQNIRNNTTKLIDYCQIMLQTDEELAIYLKKNKE